MWAGKKEELSNLQVSFKQPLDIFVGSILPQSSLEVLQLVQKSIQTLTKLQTHKTIIAT